MQIWHSTTPWRIWATEEYIQVAVRIRPFLERDRNERSVLVVDQNQIIIDKGDVAEEFAFSETFAAQVC